MERSSTNWARKIEEKWLGEALKLQATGGRV